jgi:3-oxoacyl-(acyl-carrier-protein) synthase
MDMLQLGRAQKLLVGGVEELCAQTFIGFHKIGLLARSLNGASSVCNPFDANPRGTLLGEGAAFMVLEPFDDAKARGAEVALEIFGYGTQFDRHSLYRYDPEARAASGAIRIALQDAGVDPGDIDSVSACANAVRSCDRMEAHALHVVFNSRAETIPITAAKSMLGESFSAGGAFQLALAAGAVARKVLAPTISIGKSDASYQLNCVTSAQPAPIERILIDSFGPTGVSSALIVGRAGR